MATTRITLDGEWSLRWCSEGEGEAAGWCSTGVQCQDAIVAEVPGMTHLHLLGAGEIAEPLFGRNAEQCDWMEEKDWWYSRTFRLAEDDLTDRIEVVFDGLDTFADVWVNGQHVGSCRNGLVPWRGNITPHVRAGENLIVVRIDTGLRWAHRQDISRYLFSPDAGTGDNSHLLLRRSAFSTKWDWAPRLATCGIWRSGRVELHRDMALRDVCLRSQLLSDGNARLIALVEIESFGDRHCEALLEFSLEGAVDVVLHTTVVPGQNLITHTFMVPEPRLWWPNGTGEPHLYPFTCRLRHGERKAAVDAVTFYYGIREVELQQEMLNGDDGQCFTFVVNGVPIFCRGANWVPADSLVSRVTPQHYEALLRDAIEANFNMLRVWGGGTYESDAFWNICDRLGIMVWLDFQIACQPTPEDQFDYVLEIGREAEIAIKRLRNHPSLVLWCGNNENQYIYVKLGEFWGWRTYHEILPTAVAHLDPKRPYWPSSPYGGPQFNDWDRGDRHSWQVAFSALPFGSLANYHEMAADRGKFISEYGFLAPPVRASLEQGLPADELSRGKPAWEFHANPYESGIPRGAYRNVFEEALDAYFGRNVNELDLDTYLLLTQAWQAEAYRFSLAHFRRRKFLTSGVLFWMYNDCWLATSSWSVIDYYLRRKPAFYAVKRAYSPEMVSFAEQENGLAIWLVNDRLAPAQGVLEYGTGRFSQEHAETVGAVSQHIAANCSSRVLTLPPPALSDENKADTYYWARWMRDGALISSHYRWLGTCGDVCLPDPGLRWTAKPRDDHYEVEVSASRYAWMVIIDPTADLRPEDNYFDLLPGESRTIRVSGPAQVLRDLTVSSANRLLCAPSAQRRGEGRPSADPSSGRA